MFLQNLIVGYILIKCPDQIVPVFPGTRYGIVKFMALCFRIAHQVHPMPCPSFPIGGRIQVKVYHFFVSYATGIRDKIIYFLRIRR